MKVHPLLVEAVPPAALDVLPIALQVLLAVVVEHVVLAGDEEHVLRRGALENLVHGVELFGLREVGDVARVQHELGGHRERVDLVDGRLQRPHDIGIRRLVESHVAVADLDEAKLARRHGPRHAAQGERLQDAALHDAEGSRSGPRHAGQESPPVDPVVVVVDQELVSSLRGHRLPPRPSAYP
jgi:hypothetical protein